MAHHLPRKKYLSKLLGDNPEEKYRQTSAASNTDSTSCESLSANESRESLLGAIANSTTLGISAFDSAVFRMDNNGSSSASELASSGEVPDQSKYREGPNNSADVNPELHCTADDDGKICGTSDSQNSPVYFDGGSMDEDDDEDDDDDRMQNGAQLMDDDATCSSNVASASQTSEMNSDDTMPQSAGSFTSSGIPTAASMSSLIDGDVLNGLLPSAESFANLLHSLESKDGQQMSSGRNEASHEQLNTAIHQQPRSQLAVCSPATQSDVTSSAEHSLRHLNMAGNPLSVSVECVYVKEEPIDSRFEQQQLQKAPERLTTMSGRNRGRGKATEPKYECQICGDVAAGYHCGAYVCEACKVFSITFRDIVFAFHALMLFGRQEEHPACKKLSDEVLALLSVWVKVQMICIWSS